MDADCDGASDYDADEDGYDSDSHSGSDCDDADASISPDATEVYYDGTDQDCDGASDYDADLDGWDSDVYGGADCDDTDEDVSPDAAEIWYDGFDQDCDGASDHDADGDGYDSDDHSGSDCDDTDDTVSPGSSELLDGQDNDCDDYCDEGRLSAGDLVISEIMNDPDAVSDTTGEWFEVYNATSNDIALCEGWSLSDDDYDSHDLVYTVEVPAGGYAVFGKSDNTSTNGGVSVDYVFGAALALANGADELVLYFDDPDGTPFEMSRVDWGSTWYTRGKSMNLDPDYYDESSNDDVSNWCDATTTMSSGDEGTPGALNDEC